MIQTERHLCAILKCKLEDIEDICANIESYYTEKIEPKLNKDGSPKLDKFGVQKVRIINPSKGKLKNIQTSIHKKILRNIKFPDFVHGGIKGKDNVSNSRPHLGKKYKFTTDLKDFYPSITNRQVFKAFRDNNFSPTVARWLTKLTTYKNVLPQGTPTSPYLANLVFLPVDYEIIASFEGLPITYTRFVDDLTFSSPIDFKSKTNEFMGIIRKSGFKISFDKTKYSGNVVITGTKNKNNYLDVTDEFKEKRSSLEGKTKQQIEGFIRYEKKVKSGRK